MVVDRELMERDLADHLVGREGAGLLPRSEQAQLKTYIVEAHRANSLKGARAVLEEAVGRAGADLSTTDDPSLYLLRLRVETETRSDEAGFWVDSANPRFWLLHSKSNAKPAQQALRTLLSAIPALDRGWLPRGQLRGVQHIFRPFGFRLGFDERPFYRGHDVVELQEPTHKLNVEHAGVGAESMFALLEGSEVTRRAMAVSEVAFWERSAIGTQLLRLSREGRLRSMGASLETHLQAARSLLRGYEMFVLELERTFGLRLSEDQELGVIFEGQPVALDVEKPPGFEFKQLVERLVSGVEPFRLLGTVDWIDEDLAWVSAVDLHTDAPVRLDMTPDWIRLYLRQGLCGNTVARFATNLQRSYNADFRFFDPLTAGLLGEASMVEVGRRSP
jgi:hypothetical protein